MGPESSTSKKAICFAAPGHLCATNKFEPRSQHGSGGAQGRRTKMPRFAEPATDSMRSEAVSTVSGDFSQFEPRETIISRILSHLKIHQNFKGRRTGVDRNATLSSPPSKPKLNMRSMVI